MAKRTAKEQGKYVRAKGHSFERAVANKLRHIYPDVRRHLEYHKEDADKGIDLINTGKYGIQCKAYKNYAPINKIEEVKDGIPVLVTKGNNKRPVACMYLDDYIDLLTELLETDSELREVAWEKKGIANELRKLKEEV